MVNSTIFMFLSMVPSLLRVKLVDFLPNTTPLSLWDLATVTTYSTKYFLWSPIWILGLFMLLYWYFWLVVMGGGLVRLVGNVGKTVNVVTCGFASRVNYAYVDMAICVIYWLRWYICVCSKVISVYLS